MKILKVLLSTLLVLAAVVAFGRFFLSHLGSGRPDELAAVVVSASPGYAERGEIPATATAATLEEQALRQGAVVYWLADVGGDVLEERSATTAGTRLQTQWRGGLRARLAWGPLADPHQSAPGKAHLGPGASPSFLKECKLISLLASYSRR